MGKRFKQFKNKMGLKKLPKFKDPCSVPGCKERSREKMECALCDVTMYACKGHHWEVRDKLKVHLATKHAEVAVGLVKAAIAGEGIIEE